MFYRCSVHQSLRDYKRDQWDEAKDRLLSSAREAIQQGETLRKKLEGRRVLEAA